jgi:uncharacterized protein with FMN-binding domain
VKKRVIVLILVGAVVAAVAVAAGVFAANFNKMAREMSAMTFEGIDISKVRDGTYRGACKLVPVTAVVRVRVEGGRVTGIDVLRHMHGPGYGADAFARRVVEAQSLEVDAVSGASGSSKAMKKAIENALRKGL